MVAAILIKAWRILKQGREPGTSPTLYCGLIQSSTAKTRIRTSLENVGVWVDETKWKQEKSDSPHMLNLSRER
jgi:hypothetical protein